MADTSVSIKDATGATVAVDTFTPAGGDHRQAVVIGDANAAGTVGVVNNALVTTAATAGTANRTSVSASATDKLVLSANAGRLGFTIWNNSSAVLYLGFGSDTPASTSNATVAIPAGGYYESPSPVYRGALRGVWGAANGSAIVTELSA